MQINKIWQSHLVGTMRSDIQRMILEEKAGDETTMRILHERFPQHQDGNNDVVMD
jgi:hypothetical protein